MNHIDWESFIEQKDGIYSISETGMEWYLGVEGRLTGDVNLIDHLKELMKDAPQHVSDVILSDIALLYENFTIAFSQ